ncbi:MAG: protease complex subunit PrcB family protein [Candidatus Thiodiazotropha sp.]
MDSLSISVLEKGYVCGVSQAAGVELVSDNVAKQTDNTRISATQEKSLESDPGTNPNWIVRVDMGQQPSGGYGLRLISDNLEISSDTARVALEWLQPKSGSMQVQALTYPCIYLQVAKGRYTRLDIIDQHGEVRHSLDLK